MEKSKNMPTHIGIIMDGNRRWARKKKLPIKMGHKTGADTLEKIAKYANKIGLKYMTVYAFSTENWKRSEEEVGILMGLLKDYIDDFAKTADLENIKINVVGDLSKLSQKLQKSINNSVKRTENNTGLVLSIAFNYGGRTEILKATKEIAEEVKNGELSIDDIDEKTIEIHLYTKDIPDPDLIIRTSGELRTSGFLLWRMAYSEFLFMEKYWPEFDEKDLDFAIAEYEKRNRRFGAS